MPARPSIIALLLLMLGAAPVAGSPGSEARRLRTPTHSGDAAIARTLRLPAATWANDHDGDKVFDSLEARFASSPGAPQTVIVTLVHGADTAAALQRSQDIAGPFDATDVFDTLGGFAASLRLDQVLRIGMLDAVRQIEWGGDPGRPHLDTATVNGGVRAIQTALDVDGDGEADPVTGNGVTIAVLDTGLDRRHVDLEDKILTFIDEHSGSRTRAAYDPDGHGTHVASIAAGLGRGDPALTGVAPGADLVGFRIDEDCPPSSLPYLESVQGPCGSRTNVLNAVDWMLENHEDYGIRVMSMSWGWTLASSVDGTDSLELAMDRLWEAGIIPIISAGNRGPERGTIGIPASAHGAVAIGAMSDAQWMEGREVAPHITDFTSRGPTADGRLKPELMAYGSYVHAAAAGTFDGYIEYSGTSMSAPYVAGVVALMLEANPSLTPTEIRDVLLGTAQDWGAPGPDIDTGHGLIQPLDAVREVLGGGAAADPVLPEHVTAHLSTDGPSANAAQAGIDVIDASGPLAVTVVVRGRTSPPVPDQTLFTPADRRIIEIELLAPGRSSEPLNARYETPRQVVFDVPAPVAGRYILRAHNLGRADVLDIDVTGEDISVTAPA